MYVCSFMSENEDKRYKFSAPRGRLPRVPGRVAIYLTYFICSPSYILHTSYIRYILCSFVEKEKMQYEYQKTIYF